MSTRYIFNTSGDYVAFVQGGNLWSPNSDWLGFIVDGNEVIDPHGKYMGVITNDDRVVRNRLAPARPALPRRMRPLKPLKPFKPFKRLRMTAVPQPFYDVFERKRREESPPRSQAFLESARGDFSHLLDSTLVAFDGVSLGKVNRNPFDSESMVNEFGPHGSQFETRSIFNQFGTYGNPFSPLSPYNEFSQQAPRFVKNGSVLGTLTANTFVQNRIDPEKFVEWLKSGS
ncbi:MULTISPECIES: 4-fold beta flower protein [unclassified Burkholderia]|uniref:4-fold beta flower protein n=1 Tax=unclassified Burkholderia TaxID=2613784 RepID=UPI0021505860|nr:MULTISPECIES: hypothetical protein [unclassified Burkholderia]MCR4469848.1 hypothetical protein [Burkholderia sp. SCN-KJ]